MVSQATSLRKDPTRVDPKSCTPDGGWSLPPPPPGLGRVLALTSRLPHGLLFQRLREGRWADGAEGANWPLRLRKG